VVDGVSYDEFAFSAAFFFIDSHFAIAVVFFLSCCRFAGHDCTGYELDGFNCGLFGSGFTFCCCGCCGSDGFFIKFLGFGNEIDGVIVE
jgi:hypothetical protein